MALGRAFDLQGEADSAIVYYERFVSTPYARRMYPLLYGREIGDPFWLALVYERLGALYAERGDSIRAIRYYSKLVDLWKKPDPELQPRVEAARHAMAELAGET